MVKCFFYFPLLFVLCNHLHAQVPVIEEPQHKTVLLNDFIRLIDVHLAPHDTTMYHVHAMPSVVVFISKSMIGTQDMSGKGLPSGEVLPGQTVFMDYATKPVTHRVYNSSNDVFHVMDIELEKQLASPDSCTALSENNFTTTINEKLVHVYRFEVNNSKPLTISQSNCAHLLICVSGEINTGNRKVKTGEYIFFDPNTAITINNRQTNNSTCVLLELK